MEHLSRGLGTALKRYEASRASRRHLMVDCLTRWEKSGGWFFFLTPVLTLQILTSLFCGSRKVGTTQTGVVVVGKSRFGEMDNAALGQVLVPPVQ